MGRPVKDYWNWTKIVIPHKGFSSTSGAETFLYANTASTDHYEVRAISEWPPVRKQHSTKTYKEFHFYIKDPTLASFFKLRFDR
jgi:hypothetical protein